MDIQEKIFTNVDYTLWLRRSFCIEQSSCELSALLRVTLVECSVKSFKVQQRARNKNCEVENEVEVLKQFWRHGLCFKQLILFSLWHLPPSKSLASYSTQQIGEPRDSASAVESKYLIQLIDPSCSKHCGNFKEMIRYMLTSCIIS